MCISHKFKLSLFVVTERNFQAELQCDCPQQDIHPDFTLKLIAPVKTALRFNKHLKSRTFYIGKKETFLCFDLKKGKLS